MEFLEFSVAAAGSTCKNLTCAPQSQEERAMCAELSSLPCDCGWFKVGPGQQACIYSRRVAVAHVRDGLLRACRLQLTNALEGTRLTLHQYVLKLPVPPVHAGFGCST